MCLFLLVYIITDNGISYLDFFSFRRLPFKKLIQMASRYEAMSGQAWHEELQNFLPHALDCVDPNCLLPLCVNLKLTLRHAQGCKKVDNCTICQGIKSLASSHSNSCRDYYCRVPFCMEAKVTAQQQVLMDELGKVFDAGLDSQEDGETIHPSQDTKEECRREEASRMHSDSHCMAVRNSETSTPVELNNGPSGNTPATQAPLSEASYFQLATKNSTQVPDSVEPILPDLRKRSSTVQKPKHPQSGLHESLHENYIPTCTLKWLPSKADIFSVTNQPRPAPKRKCEAITVSTGESASPPTKVIRGASTGLKSQQDDSPEIEIIGIKSSGRLANQLKGTAPPNDTNRCKEKSSKAVFSPRAPLRIAAKKQDEKAGSMSHQCHFTKRNTLPKKVPSFKPTAGVQYSKVSAKSRFTFSDSSQTDFHQACQDEGKVNNDLVDDFLEEMFSTPPPSPTFEMWLGENAGSKENSSALKVVLLETLFQLFGVVTQPKTEKQEAVFVDLLERTLGMMKTEIAKW